MIEKKRGDSQNGKGKDRALMGIGNIAYYGIHRQYPALD